MHSVKDGNVCVLYVLWPPKSTESYIHCFHLSKEFQLHSFLIVSFSHLSFWAFSRISTSLRSIQPCIIALATVWPRHGRTEETDFYLGFSLCVRSLGVSWVIQLSTVPAFWVPAQCHMLTWSPGLPSTPFPRSNPCSQYFLLIALLCAQLWFQLVATWGHFRFWW